MGYDVVGVGVASLDLIGVIEGEPRFGAKQALSRWLEMGGGPVATALATLARLGARVAMAGAVGDDGYGARIIEDLRAWGIDPVGMHVRPGASHVAFVLAEPGRDRRTVFFHHDRAVLTNIPLDRELITSARALALDTHLSDTALQAARWMRAAGGLVMLDAERLRENTWELLPLCDFLIVSENFGREATGMDHPAEAARGLHARYGRLVIVTAGAAGSWCAHQGEVFHTPAFEIEPVDTTGAGDVFHGAFLYAILAGYDVRRAVRFASAAAAISCRGLGGRGNLPTLGDIEAFLKARG